MSTKISVGLAIDKALGETAKELARGLCDCCSPSVKIYLISDAANPTGSWIDKEGITHAHRGR